MTRNIIRTLVLAVPVGALTAAAAPAVAQTYDPNQSVIVVEQGPPAGQTQAQAMGQPTQTVQVDAYGNPVPQQQPPLDPYGNPIGQPAGAPGMPEPFDQPRFRAGFNLYGGTVRVPGSGYDGGGLGGASVRLGLQIDRNWAVYYQLMGSVGGYGYIDDSTSYVETAVFALSNNTLGVGYTLVDRLEFGLGLSLDSIAAVGAAADASGAAAAYVIGGNGFGLDMRFMAGLGRHNPGMLYRRGFALTLNFHPSFFDGVTLMTATLGIGAEWY